MTASTFRSRWLDWRPGEGLPVSADEPSLRPSRPSRLETGGSGGAVPEPSRDSRWPSGGSGGAGSGPSGDSDPRPLAPVVPFDPVARISQALGPNGRGWVAVRSRVLGETVLWTREAATEVPFHVAGLVRFTWEELDLLADGDAEALRAAFRAKKALDGTVTAFRRTTP